MKGWKKEMELETLQLILGVSQTPEQVEQYVTHITEMVQKVFKVNNLRVSEWTTNFIYYEAETQNGRPIVIEVAVDTLESFALLDEKGWRYIGQLNKIK